jgi:hypothetical protein
MSTTEGRCAAGLVCLATGRSDSITILGDLLATYLPYFMCSMPIGVKTPTGLIVAHVCFSHKDVPRGTKIESCSPQSRRRLSFNGSLWNL